MVAQEQKVNKPTDFSAVTILLVRASLFVFLVENKKNYAVVTSTLGWGFCNLECEGLFIV